MCHACFFPEMFALHSLGKLIRASIFLFTPPSPSPSFPFLHQVGRWLSGSCENRRSWMETPSFRASNPDTGPRRERFPQLLCRAGLGAATPTAFPGPGPPTMAFSLRDCVSRHTHCDPLRAPRPRLLQLVPIVPPRFAADIRRSPHGRLRTPSMLVQVLGPSSLAFTPTFVSNCSRRARQCLPIPPPSAPRGNWDRHDSSWQGVSLPERRRRLSSAPASSSSFLLLVPPPLPNGRVSEGARARVWSPFSLCPREI